LLQIVKYPHPALRYDARPIQRIDEALRRHVREMFDLMYESRGIGLAATQVALPFRFFVLNVTADPAATEEERVLINPEIVKRHSRVEGEEGCLSFPGIYANLPRARRIRVRAFDLTGNEVTIDADDLLSRAIQHETDHLSGRLFIDYVSDTDLAKLRPQIRELEQQFRRDQESGAVPDDPTLVASLDSLAGAGLSLPPTEALTGD
jgi:peptide deformylase